MVVKREKGVRGSLESVHTNLQLFTYLPVDVKGLGAGWLMAAAKGERNDLLSSQVSGGDDISALAVVLP